MTFGLKNVDATYQRSMNLIFHDLLGILLEIYIDDHQVGWQVLRIYYS
jgi:hypothetical protein